MFAKKLLLFVFSVVMLSSCSRFTQVVYVSPKEDNIQSVNHFYQYENEDVKIVYWFWAEHGVMSFLFWNKTDKPLYIDWKKSALINNGKRLSYYTNRDVNNYKSFGTTYGLDWLDVFNDYYTKSGSTDMKLSKETLVRGERVSFIPPKSYITQAFYNLTANIYFDINDRNTQEESVNFCKVYVSTSNQEINFRNYITYAFNEKGENEQHVDNEFRLNKVVTMQNDYFNFKDKNGFWANDWERPTRFYIHNLRWDEIYK